MQNHFIALLLFFILSLSLNKLQAQEPSVDSGLRWYLSEDKSSYAGLITVNQVWTRYIQNNPDKSGTAQYPDYDLGIRRSRLLMYTYLMDKVFMYTQVGYDGQTYLHKNQGLQLLNAQTEYIFAKDKLHLGFGLNTWNGVSRYNNSMPQEYLVVDNPGFAYPVGGTFDRAGRQLGIYAKGTLDKLHYRISVVKPFETGIDSVSAPVTTGRMNENLAFKGYFTWQFLDKENTLFPYMTMNNVGRQKLFNIGAGFYYHPEAMLVEAEKDLSTVDPMLAALLIAAGQEHLIEQFAGYFPSQVSDVFIAAADAFLDIPLRNSGALTSYLGYCYNFFGPNYLRSMGVMNVSKMQPGLALPQGRGNSEWENGTGHIIRGELGYLLPGKGLQNRIQPYAAFTWKNFEALDEASLQFDAGINWLMYGHNIKWTLQYSSRPVYGAGQNFTRISEHRGQLFLQTQIYF
ncbi:MAG: hypothetical protein ACOC0R_01270 [Mariniphaga sp.]